jgi:hypothetical protein
MKEVRRMLFEIFYVTLDPFSRIIEGMNFINPEGLMIESIIPQGKTKDEAKNENK